MSKKKDKKKKQKKQEQQEIPKAIENTSARTKKLVRWIVLCLMTLIVVFLSLHWIPGEIHYEIIETYSITAEDEGVLHLAVLLPTSGPYQEVSDPEITWPSPWNIDSAGRLDVLRMEADLQGGEIVQAIIQYRVNLSQGKARWFGPLITPEDLSSTEDIQSDHPDIIAQAQALMENGDLSASAQNIFNFTARHLHWPREDRLDPDLSALSAYQSGVGGCTEHANLMSALCRAIDIPSRPVSGLAMPETLPFFTVSTTWGHPAAAHAWVELFVDDVWIMADPSWSGGIFKRDLYAWTDGRHLVYDTTAHEAQVYESFESDANQSGTLIAAMSAPLRFVAWSEESMEGASLSPEVTVRKTWDARYIWMVSIILIMIILNWVIKTK